MSDDQAEKPEIADGERSAQIFYKNSYKPNPNHSNYGNGLAEIIDYALLDHKAVACSKFHFNNISIILMKVRFCEDVDDPIFAFTIRDLQGLEITGTNSLVKGVSTGNFKANDVVTVKFQQRLNLRSGVYSLCLGCTGYSKDELVVYNRLYDILLFDVIATTQTFSVGFFDLHSDMDISRPY